VGSSFGEEYPSCCPTLFRRRRATRPPAARRALLRSIPRIHVVGSSPRSGTTLLFELLIAGFEIDRFGEHEIGVFERPEAPVRPYASKRPNDMVHVCRVLRWDPALHVIYLQRDPRDVVVSQHGSAPGRYWCDFGPWRRNQRLLESADGHPRLFVCAYEDLVRDPDGMQAAIAERFPFLARRNAFSDFEKVSDASEAARAALRGVRGVSTASVGKWREDLPRVAAQLEAFPDMPDYLMRVGYERDRAWLAALAGVAPDRTPSVHVDRNQVKGATALHRAAERIARRASSLRDELLHVTGYSR
jgi:hypothetical protein